MAVRRSGPLLGFDAGCPTDAAHLLARVTGDLHDLGLTHAVAGSFNDGFGERGPRLVERVRCLAVRLGGLFKSGHPEMIAHTVMPINVATTLDVRLRRRPHSVAYSGQ